MSICPKHASYSSFQTRHLGRSETFSMNDLQNLLVPIIWHGCLATKTLQQPEHHFILLQTNPGGTATKERFGAKKKEKISPWRRRTGLSLQRFSGYFDLEQLLGIRQAHASLNPLLSYEITWMLITPPEHSTISTSQSVPCQERLTCLLRTAIKRYISATQLTSRW